MSILAQIIGLACLLFWGFWLCCKLRLPAGFAPLCGLCFCMVVLQLAGSCNQLWLGPSCCLWGLCSPWRSAAVTKFCPSCSPRVCWPFAALLGC